MVKLGPKEQQLRNLKAAKAARKSWVARKKQETVKVLRKQINRKERGK